MKSPASTAVGTTAAHKKRSALAIFLGFTPWITWSFLTRYGALGFGIAFAIAATLLALEVRRGGVKAMELASTGFFGVQLLLTGALRWNVLEDYNLVLLYGALAMMAWTTLLIQSPFTLQYAREDWPRELWNQPLFRQTNTILTFAWGVIFTAGAASAALAVFDPQRPIWLYGVVLPHVGTLAGILLSIAFPKLYPRWMLARQLATQTPPTWQTPTYPAQRPFDADHHDVVVVGAGIGGLSAAAIMALRGLKVLVLDHHYLPGGFCTAWPRYVGRGAERKTFIFDAGVHDVSGLGPNGPVRWLLKRLGIEQEVEFRHLPHEYRFPGLSLKVPRSAQDYVKLLGDRFPAERENVAAFFAEMEAVYRDMYSDIPRTGGVPFRPSTVEEMLAYPEAHPHFIRWMDEPFTQMLNSYIADPDLRKVLSVLTGYLTDTPANLTVGAFAPIYGYYFDGGGYPVGSSQHLANALVGVIESAGGEVRLRTGVARILIEEGYAAGVVLTDGSVEHATTVLSNADVNRTYLELVGKEHLPADLAERVRAIKPSASAIWVSLGLDNIPDIEAMTLVQQAPSQVGIMTPSKVDPALAPPGHSAMVLIGLAPPDLQKAWDRKSPEYRRLKQEAGDVLVAAAERVIPDLRKHIVYRQDATPATVERYAWTTGGSIYGPALGWRPEAKTPIPGLVLAGSGTFPGAGIEAVVISGMIAADLLCPHAVRDPVRVQPSATKRDLPPEAHEEAPMPMVR